jgi:5-methylcytosine-specific restriction protein A
MTTMTQRKWDLGDTILAAVAHWSCMCPIKAPRPCMHPGCPEMAMTQGSRCLGHKRERQSAEITRRMESPEAREHKAFYDSSTWRKFRLEVLRREPFCRACRAAGCVRLAEMVDHIVPIRHGGDRLSWANLAPLCHACHNAKRGEEAHGASAVQSDDG